MLEILTIIAIAASAFIGTNLDNLVLLAESNDFSDLEIIPVFLAMVAGFAWLARYLVNHPQLSHALKRYGQYVTPFILILVGVYILSNTASDLMPGS